MGRKRLVLTEADIQARKLKYWGPKRNEARRERYHADPEVRQALIQAARTTYRNRREEMGQQVRADDCRNNIPLLAQIGQIRSMTGVLQGKDMLTFTLDELAKAMGRNPQVLHRWINTDLFPTTAFEGYGVDNRLRRVYIAEEAINLLGAFGKHLETRQYFKEFHTDTKEAMFAAVANIRQREGVTAHDREPAKDTRPHATSHSASQSPAAPRVRNRVPSPARA